MFGNKLYFTKNCSHVFSKRDFFESQLFNLFGKKLLPTEEAFDVINAYKSKNFAFSQVGLMLYTNGYNLRGISNRHPNGLIYFDGENVFGIGIFKKESSEDCFPHLMIIAPQGPSFLEAVMKFISKVRQCKIFSNEIYIRHLSSDQKKLFIESGLKDIELAPWHEDAPEEDEHFPNRQFYLKDIFDLENNYEIKNLSYPDAKNFKSKPRLIHNRFSNYLQRNNLKFTLEPYEYSSEHIEQAKLIVTKYFQARTKRGGVLGSTPEDYFPIIYQRPSGINGRDYFAYIGKLKKETSNGLDLDTPIMFFVGERLGPKNQAGLYATLSSRFEEDAVALGLPMEGYTALPQFCILEVMKKMFESGIEIVDIGGSETEGLDIQKKQLGGRPHKTSWVVSI